jgi:hypothetical protein
LRRIGKGNKMGAFPKRAWAHFPRKTIVLSVLKFIAMREAVFYGFVQSVQQRSGHIFRCNKGMKIEAA